MLRGCPSRALFGLYPQESVLQNSLLQRWVLLLRKTEVLELRR